MKEQIKEKVNSLQDEMISSIQESVKIPSVISKQLKIAHLVKM
ncbi:peptidase, M20A family domain protein [Clostridioides difficile]|nr:peptidase, M20A family domain protein [Clostridioides difficile]EQE91648.1 peptidase, M20A family domain protein [Clostridioides difficile CD104]